MCALSLSELLARLAVATDRMPSIQESVKAKRKYEDEHRTFLPEWEELFAERNGKHLCLICQTSLSHFKASNLERRLSTHHANIAQEFPKGTELCKHKVNTLSRQSEKQTQLFRKFTKYSETVTLALYQVAWNIARAKKSYSEGEFVMSLLSSSLRMTDVSDLQPSGTTLNRGHLTLTIY